MEWEANYINKEQITSVMEQAFLAASNTDTKYLADQYKHDPMLYVYRRVAHFKLLQQKSFANVDWPDTEAKLGAYNEAYSAEETTAYDYADMLLGAALDDAQVLITESMKALPDEILKYKDSVASTLIESKNTLLQIALIGEDEHRKITQSSTSAQILEFDGSRLQWTSDVAEAIKQNRATQKEGVGCPAHSRVIDYRGRKTTLLSAFWESLVTYVFEPQQEVDC